MPPLRSQRTGCWVGLEAVFSNNLKNSFTSLRAHTRAIIDNP